MTDSLATAAATENQMAYIADLTARATHQIAYGIRNPAGGPERGAAVRQMLWLASITTTPATKTEASDSIDALSGVKPRSTDDRRALKATATERHRRQMAITDDPALVTRIRALENVADDDALIAELRVICGV